VRANEKAEAMSKERWIAMTLSEIETVMVRLLKPTVSKKADFISC
jgi:hypothetical protein